MRKIRFYKYHGAGNDFIIIDNREQKVVFDASDQIASICNRHTGIGADGLILLEESGSYDFRMKYYNSDGNESSMCGNGGRCIVAFASMLGIIGNETTFEAIDGIHHAVINSSSENAAHVSLHMKDVTQFEKVNTHYIIDTGSPHFVKFEKNISKIEVSKEGRIIRNSDPYHKEGINVNFVSSVDGNHYIRTYERGVEDETMSCGTGCVAAVIALTLEGKVQNNSSAEIHTEGGILSVEFKRVENGFTNVILSGPAVQVFEGLININQ